MDYRTGTPGRIITIRLHPNDPIYSSIESVAAKENVQNGIIWMIGGATDVSMVVGPKDGDAMPIEGIKAHFNDPREILGFGTLFRDESDKPTLHMHASFGKGSEVLTGCPRESAHCWLINEVIMMEIKGINARRLKDPLSGFSLLTLL